MLQFVLQLSGNSDERNSRQWHVRSLCTQTPRAALTGRHDTLVRRAPGWPAGKQISCYKMFILQQNKHFVTTNFLPAGLRGPLASRGPYLKLESILPVYQQSDWGPGMVKCVGPTRCLMRPCRHHQSHVLCLSTDCNRQSDITHTFCAVTDRHTCV